MVYPFVPDSQPVRVPRAEIVRIEPSPVSPMPAGLVNRMSAGEWADLIAYRGAASQ
jgi:hypothetical protein